MIRYELVRDYPLRMTTLFTVSAVEVPEKKGRVTCVNNDNYCRVNHIYLSFGQKRTVTRVNQDNLLPLLFSYLRMVTYQIHM